MATMTSNKSLPWVVLVCVLGGGGLLLVDQQRGEGELRESMQQARLDKESAERRARRLSKEVLNLRAAAVTRTLAPDTASDVAPAAKKPLTTPIEPVSSDPLATSQRADAVGDAIDLRLALHEVLAGMGNGEDLRAPVRLGTHPALLPALDQILGEEKFRAKAWYYQSLFEANDIDRVRDLLARFLPDEERALAAAGYFVARVSERSGAPLPFIESLLEDEDEKVRLGAVSGLGQMMTRRLEVQQAFSLLVNRVGDGADSVAIAALDALSAHLVRDALLKGRLSPDSLLLLQSRTSELQGPRLDLLLDLFLSTGWGGAMPSLVALATADSVLEAALLGRVAAVVDTLEHAEDGAAAQLESANELAAFLEPGKSERMKEWRDVLARVIPQLSTEGGDYWNALIGNSTIATDWGVALSRGVWGEHPDQAAGFSERVRDAAQTGRADHLKEKTEGLSVRRRAAVMARFAFADGVDPSVRRAGVNALAIAETHLVLPLLQHLVGDVDEQVRSAAAASLAKHSVSAGIAYLEQVIQTNPESRFDAMQSLLAAGNAPSFTAALSVITSGDVLNTWFLVDACIQSKRAMPEESIRAMLQGGTLNPWRADSYYGYFDGVLGDKLTPLLVDLLVEDEIPTSLQHVVIRWLASCAEPRLVELLDRFLESELDEVKEATLYALATLGGAEARVDRLLELTTETDPFVLVQLAYCLATSTNPLATNALVTLTKHSQPAVREASTRVLGGRRHPTVLPALKGRFSIDDEVEVVNAALMSLVRCGNHDHMDKLMSHIDTPWVGPRTLRFLKEHFSVDLSTQQEWVAWWEQHQTEWTSNSGSRK